MRLHGLAAFGRLFVFGASRRITSRKAGASATAGAGHASAARGDPLQLAATLALTGYLLYYFAPETVRPALGWLHSGLGVAMAVVVAAHRRGAGGRPHHPEGVANERKSHSHVHRGRAAVPPRP